jgi:hypothetical protein
MKDTKKQSRGTPWWGELSDSIVIYETKIKKITPGYPLRNQKLEYDVKKLQE